MLSVPTSFFAPSPHTDAMCSYRKELLYQLIYEQQFLYRLFLLFLWIVIKNIFIPSIINICNPICLPTSRKIRNHSFKIKVILPSSAQWTLRDTPSVTNTHHDSWSLLREPETWFSISFTVHPPLILLMVRSVTSPSYLPACPPTCQKPVSSSTHRWAHHHWSPTPMTLPTTKQVSNY